MPKNKLETRRHFHGHEALTRGPNPANPLTPTYAAKRQHNDFVRQAVKTGFVMTRNDGKTY